MPKIVFYRQKRRDGGLHTGVEIDGHTALEREEGVDWENGDPVLLWYVELRCEGKKLPTRPEEARKWLLEHGPLIREGFEALTKDLRVGIDYNTLPLLWPLPKVPRGVRMLVACHAMHRSDALAMAQATAEIASHWEEWIEKLPVLERA